MNNKTPASKPKILLKNQPGEPLVFLTNSLNNKATEMKGNANKDEVQSTWLTETGQNSEVQVVIQQKAEHQEAQFSLKKVMQRHIHDTEANEGRSVTLKSTPIRSPLEVSTQLLSWLRGDLP